MKRVLFVEDEPRLRLLCHLEFEPEGYQVLDAGTALEAMEQLEREGADVVVLDLRLPDRSGLELLQDILRRWRHLPVIIYTAYDAYREDFLCWGAEAYLIKSGDLTELKRMVAQLSSAAPESPGTSSG